MKRTGVGRGVYNIHEKIDRNLWEKSSHFDDPSTFFFSLVKLNVGASLLLCLFQLKSSVLNSAITVSDGARQVTLKEFCPLDSNIFSFPL